MVSTAVKLPCTRSSRPGAIPAGRRRYWCARAWTRAPAPGPRQDLDRHPGAERRPAGTLEQPNRCRDLPAVGQTFARPVHRLQTLGPEQAARHQQRGDRHTQRLRTHGRARGHRHGGAEHHRLDRRLAQKEAAHQRRDGRVGRAPTGVERDEAVAHAGPGSGRDRFAERREALLADAFDVTQLVDRAKAPLLVAELHDPLGQRRPDPVELVQLVDGGRRQAELRPTRRCGGPRPGPRRPAPPRAAPPPAAP